MKSLTIFTTKKDISLPLFYTETILSQWTVHHHFYEDITVAEVAVLTLGNVVYMRDPFNGVFEEKLLLPILEALLSRKNEATYFVDHISTLEDIYFEDKWIQYKLFKEYMPLTFLSTDTHSIHPPKIYKKRISSRARDIYFTKPEIDLEEYIAQERVVIEEEYRVLEVCKEILPIMAVKRSKSETTTVKILESIPVTPDVQAFVELLQTRHPFELVGYDIARTTEGMLMLIEVNRSPQVKAFEKESSLNPFEILLNTISQL